MGLLHQDVPMDCETAVVHGFYVTPKNTGRCGITCQEFSLAVMIYVLHILGNKFGYK
jgi:hypothetical protein